jgi:uncharacterized protein YndB with AHSA1/START domain
MIETATRLDPLYETVTFNRVGGRIVARFGLNLENHLDEVWSAFTDPNKLAEWLVPGEIEPRPGGAVTLNLVQSGQVVDGFVNDIVLGKYIQFVCSAPGEAERKVRVELEPVGAATGLVLTLDAPDGEEGARSAATWATHLEMLVAALAGSPIKFPVESFTAAHEAYKERLARLG